MIEEINKYDKGFSVDALIKYAKDLYNALINSLTSGNIRNMYPYLSETLYNKYQEMIDGYKKMKINRIIEDISIKDVVVQSYEANQNEVMVKIILVSKYRDYFMNDMNEIVNEGEDKLIEKGHYITFKRNLTVQNSKYIISDMDIL